MRICYLVIIQVLFTVVWFNNLNIESILPVYICTANDVTPTQTVCGEDLFACDNGRCIYNGFRCDRIDDCIYNGDDCGDASDEQNCGMIFACQI